MRRVRLMKKTKILCALTALAMFTSMLASCGDTTNSNSDKETVTTPVTVKSSTAEVSSPTETNEDSSSVADSSEYETTTTKTSLDDSSDSEKTETTTKAVTDSSDKETKETTSAKQTTAQPKATTTTKAVVTTTTVRATQSTAKPVVTTKTTTKAIMKETTRATTKATTKAQPTNVLAGLPDYKQALGRCILNTWTQADLEIIRKHYLAYGQKLAPRYIQDKNLTYFIDPKTGKGTNDWKPYFNPQNPPNAPMTCQEPKPIARGYNALGSGNILEQIKYADNDLQRIVSQGLNYYNWKTADSSWELAWYIQFGYAVGGKELYFLCITQAR